MTDPLMLTISGRRINPLNVRPEDVDEKDIAHHLALINRFNGATERPISVAQHVVYVSRLLEGTGFEWIGLHHDDAEAYVGDVTKWLKQSEAMRAFREADDRAQRACYEHFRIPRALYDDYPGLMPPPVYSADKLMVRFEGLQGFGRKIWEAWSNEVVVGYPMVTAAERERIGAWRPWPWRVARDGYLDQLRALRLRGLGEP